MDGTVRVIFRGHITGLVFGLIEGYYLDDRRDRALERGGSSRDAWERDWVMWVLWEVIGTLGGSESLVKLESVLGGTTRSHSSGLKVDTFLSHFDCWSRR
jgi:hypothetical protein